MGSLRYMKAANHGYKYLVQILLDEGVEPNIATGLGSTPLHCAVHYGWKEVVGLLLDRGAKPNMADVLGRTHYMLRPCVATKMWYKCYLMEVPTQT